MTGAKLDKTHTEFVFFKASPDESRKSPCSKIYPPQKLAVGAETGRYGGIIIIAPEYKLAAVDCRSPGAPGAPRVVVSCWLLVVNLPVGGSKGLPKGCRLIDCCLKMNQQIKFDKDRTRHGR